MQLLLITPPQFHKNEARILEEAVDIGVDTIHIRKKDISPYAEKVFLEMLPEKVLRQSVQHGHETLFKMFPFKGFHYSEYARKLYGCRKIADMSSFLRGRKATFSTSAHHADTLSSLENTFDYVFCSPVFPSISKQGYFTDYEWNVKSIHSKSKLIALGGIDHTKIEECKQRGFDGVAVLGAVWQQKNPRDILSSLIKIKDECERWR